MVPDGNFPEDYVERVYASILAMNAGIRLGAPVEPTEWTPETIRAVYGEVWDYVKHYTVFSADDDANGPIFFLRSLIDFAKDRPFDAQVVANTWLNYMREGVGMIWWGGDQVSTEHTAYLNLRKGIPAPASGSIETNGALLAEQIGGQIFIDSFALLFPRSPKKAADYAEIAASVSHDGEGIYGARFMAACIAAAFTKKDVHAIIEEGLKVIPESSTYAKVTHAVIDFHKKNPTDFRACRQYLEEEWGYDKYGGICHIIPNSGVCVLALLYGEGNVSRSIEIATMCGWDTDCNAGNVGSIVGVLQGVEGIKANYRQPINDAIVASSVSGYLNIVDLPTIAKQLALIGYRENGVPAPSYLVNSYHGEDVYFDFLLPGSTHGFKTNFPFKTFLSHTEQAGPDQTRGLEIFIDRMFGADTSNVYYQSFYRRAQFMDEKYSPNFAPTAYSGQTVSMQISAEQLSGGTIFITPYIKTTYAKEIIYTGERFIPTKDWQTVKFIIPDTYGDLVEEVGFQIRTDSLFHSRAFGKIYLKDFHIHGTPSYSINFAKQVTEFRSITPFAHHNGTWQLQEDRMLMSSDRLALSLTGHYFMRNTVFTTLMKPLEGNNHLVLFRSEGIERYYYAGFESEGEVVIGLADDGKREILARAPYDLQLGKYYKVTVSALRNKIKLFIEGKLIIEATNDRFEKGMIGMGTHTGGTCECFAFKVNMG